MTGAVDKVLDSARETASYSVADIRETAELCLIAKEPELLAAFIAAKTPIVKVRAALTERAIKAFELRVRVQAINAQWDAAVSKVNAETTGSIQ
jgi:hypothetical protein